jgi:hypothetical protein|tara:strand:- start:609 stop:959 length:351 start_codon:yes stop_codon:yes gene_type:complete
MEDIYDKVSLATPKRESLDIHITKQDIKRTYYESPFYIKISYSAKGWWGRDIFTLSRDKTLSEFSSSGEWVAHWSSGGQDDSINVITRLETVQQIMEDMKYFLEYGKFMNEVQEEE